MSCTGEGIRTIRRMSKKLMVNFEKILGLEDKWRDYRMSGNVNLSGEEKKWVEHVYKQIFNRTFCQLCPGDIANAFEKVFLQYEQTGMQTGSEPEPRQKRKRI